MQRRAFGLTLAAAPGGLALALAGCGFELRRAPAMRFRTIVLKGFDARSAVAALLKQRIDQSSTTRVVEAMAQAEVVFEAVTDARERSVVASTSAGQVREITLRSRLEFRLTTAGGRELIPLTQLLLSRDMSYNESVALAKQQEESELFRAMQADIVDQVLRRLAAVPAI